MISHIHKCIFIHIPKCAGTSIERALGHLDNHSGRGGQDHRTIRMIEKPILTSNFLLSKGNLLEILFRVRHKFRSHTNSNNKFTVTKDQYKSYFKFTFIRNPWARAYSWYRNVMRDEIHKINYNITGPLSLKEFLRLYSSVWHLRPQTCWIKDFSGEIPFHYIGRFENLADDFEEVCKLMNLGSITLPHKIKGLGVDYRKAYDMESIELVREMYMEEIKLFGYSFES